MKSFSSILAATLCVALANPALAGSATTGSISVLYAVPNAVVFAQNGTRSGAPGCATGGWAVDSTTPGGQSMASVLLAAYAQHKRIWIQGDGTCSVWGDRETIIYFGVED